MLVKELAENERLTVRELIGKLGGGRGHRSFAGIPEQIADDLQSWFENGAAGRLQHHAVLPARRTRGLRRAGGADLQRRGLFRNEYTADTLRGHYGLEPVASRFAGDRAEASA